METSSSDNSAEEHPLHVVDTSRAKDGVWLVKVPNYLADLWLNSNSDGVVGKVVISTLTHQNVPSGTKPESQVRLVTDNNLIAESGETGKLVPKEHQFLIQSTAKAPPSTNSRPGQGVRIKRPPSLSGQELVILCEEDIDPVTTVGSSHSASSTMMSRPSKRYSLFGRVNSRAECRPPPNSKYMMLKAQQLKAKNKARHEVRILSEPVINYKPVSNHAPNIDYEMRKKLEGKNIRRERDDVLRDLFKAFESHQYYAIKDLTLRTKQPVTYLTELLREIAIFNVKQPHKHMWELKPEYRHYTPKEIPKHEESKPG